MSTDAIGLTQGSLIRDPEIRLWIYQHFVETGRAPSPVEIAAHFQLTPGQVDERLRRLQDEADALVLLPGSSYIWMAEPFSAQCGVASPHDRGTAIDSRRRGADRPLLAPH